MCKIALAAIVGTLISLFSTAAHADIPCSAVASLANMAAVYHLYYHYTLSQATEIAIKNWPGAVRHTPEFTNIVKLVYEGNFRPDYAGYRLGQRCALGLPLE